MSTSATNPHDSGPPNSSAGDQLTPGPPEVDTIRSMLAKKRAEGAGDGNALVFTVMVDHPQVQIPDQLRAAGRHRETFVLQRRFWDLEDTADSFAVTLAFKGIRETIVCPYAALSDFYERTDPPVPMEGGPFFSATLPTDVGAIKSALRIKADAGPGEHLALMVRFPTERGSFTPGKPPRSEDGMFNLALSHNYWDLSIGQDGFEVTILHGLRRQRISVPYDAVALIYGFSFYPENELQRFGHKVVSNQSGDPPEVTTKYRKPSLRLQVSGARASIAIAVLLSSLVLGTVSAVLVALATHQNSIHASRIIFFSYLSPEFLAALGSGHVPARLVLSDLSLLGGLTAFWAAMMFVTGISFVLPMQDRKPFRVQAGVTGFFYAYLLSLLLYGGFTISSRYVPGVLRMLWIVIVFALCERAKRAYPEKWAGAEYFPAMVDGLFAIAASTIIAQGIDDAYDQALSGPVFVLIYFTIMLLFGRRMIRRRLIQQLGRRWNLEPDVVMPSEENGRLQFGMEAAKELSASRRRNRERLVMLSFEELEAEYSKGIGRARKFWLGGVRLRDAEFRLVALFSLLTVVVWPPCVLWAAWAATNLDLHLIGAGR